MNWRPAIHRYNETLRMALLRWVSQRQTEDPTSTRDQIAVASSWNAVAKAKRRPAGSSTASS
jgi:hypothetical protein